MSESQLIQRRTLLQQAAALAAAAGSLAGRAQAQTAPVPDTTRFFPGFRPLKVETSGATINGVVGGQGPPMLLLHGAPQFHITWRLVAPELAKDHTVVATDLRGYGYSSKPPDDENHANYSKRAMALDQVEVMRHLGFERFAVIGQDRGGRVTQRLILDHSDKVTKAAVLDIIPTYYLYTHVTLEFIQAYFHWFQNVRPAPIPEDAIKASYASRTMPTGEVQAEYFRAASDPSNIHGMCEDYRAGASIDLEHDRMDLDKKITCPLLVLWADPGAMGRLYDVLAIWKERGTNVFGKGMTGGHNLQEGNPQEVLAEIRNLLRM